MLKAYLLSALFCVFATTSSLARILRINNNPGIAADFKTVQAAHDAADPGDTLYLEGSPNNYGNITCRKKLLIIGTGYYLAENPNTQELLQTAKVYTVIFETGSVGSVMIGLEILNSMDIREDSITIKRNKFIFPNPPNQEASYIRLYIGNRLGNSNLPANNITISQNYGLYMEIARASTGILITGNYFTYASQSGDQSYDCLSINPQAVAVVENNIFRRGKVTVNEKTVFTNNIMYAGFFEGGGSMVTNNLGNGNQFGTMNGNKSGVDMNSVFVGIVNGVYTDAQWKLKAGSPALGAGFGSTPQNPIDAGMYSGKAPYVISGLPPIPAIYFFQITPIGSNTIPITVDAKVKSGG